jgi:uncharacterized cupin superfamily protein
MTTSPDAPLVDTSLLAAAAAASPGPSYWVQDQHEFVHIVSGTLTVTPDGGSSPATRCQAPGARPMIQPNSETIRTPRPSVHSGRIASRIAPANRS